jgi:hypothetical protein
MDSNISGKHAACSEDWGSMLDMAYWKTLTFAFLPLGPQISENNYITVIVLLQINFMDHTKIIMCPLMAAVTYIDEKKNFRTFRFSSIEQNGCNKQLASCIKYAFDKINLILS